MGLLRPAILLPMEFISREDRPALAAALRHEEAHVRNGDLRHLAVLRLLLPVLYLHPLYWWMRRRVRLDQELLADAAATGADRTTYAETLLSWAGSAAAPRRERYAGALALIERPSDLQRRIAALLDPTWNTEPRCPRIWRVSAWGLVLPAAVALSFATLRPGAVAAASGSDASNSGSAAADSIGFRGRVVDPDGRPFVGARLFLNYSRSEDRDRPQPVRAVSDREGHFRFTLARTDFDRPHIEPWQNARVVAFADGYAPSGSDSDSYDHDRELNVRLSRDDVPVTGRLVDLEGRPVAGATIRVVSISAAPGGDLGPWISAVNARQGNLYQLEFRYLKDLRAPMYDRLPEMPPVLTAPDGRFTIGGIGRERLADLRIEGPAIRTSEASVMTRTGEAVRVPIFGRRKEDWFKVYYPARLELTAPPSRPIEGIVRDRDTGAPIPARGSAATAWPTWTSSTTSSSRSRPMRRASSA